MQDLHRLYSRASTPKTVRGNCYLLQADAGGEKLGSL